MSRAIMRSILAFCELIVQPFPERGKLKADELIKSSLPFG
jgi:hypothetical protein